MTTSTHTSGTDVSGMTAGALRYGRRVPTTRPQWRRAARWMLGMQLYLAVWFWVLAAALWLVAVVVMSQTPVGVQLSYFQFLSHGALWYPFALMITVSGVMLTAHVTNGMTRRSFIRASLLTVAAVALGYGLVMAGGLALEGLVYDAFGWPHTHVANAAGDATIWEPWSEGYGTSWLAYAVRTAGGAMSGLLVGMTYYRYGGLRGTLALPLTIAPALVSQDWIAGILGDTLNVSLVALSLAALVLPVLGGLAYHRMTRTTPIAKPGS